MGPMPRPIRFTFMGGLDDGPWLPGCAPRRRPKRKRPSELKAIREKAWATRRAKYGPRGHA